MEHVSLHNSGHFVETQGNISPDWIVGSPKQYTIFVRVFRPCWERFYLLKCHPQTHKDLFDEFVCMYVLRITVLISAHWFMNYSYKIITFSVEQDFNKKLFEHVLILRYYGF